MDPRADLLRLVNGYRISQAIHVAAELGLSEQLAGGPLTADELAQATGSHPRSLYRLLRALATVGLYEELADGRFRCTPTGEQLRSDALASWASFIGQSSTWQAWGALQHSVRTGETAFEAVHGKNVWAYRAEHPAEGAIFDDAMTAISRFVADAVLDAFDFSRFATVADIGGGRGAMLTAILSRYPTMRGLLFDQPHVVKDAGELMRQAGVADRCEIVAGDIFSSMPHGPDAFVLKSILHDWPDQQAVAILEVCKAALAPGGRVLILERVISGPPYPANAAPKAFSDLNMLVGPGGQERTRGEFGSLLHTAGLKLIQVVDTATDVSIVEAG